MIGTEQNKEGNNDHTPVHSQLFAYSSFYPKFSPISPNFCRNDFSLGKLFYSMTVYIMF